MMNPVAELVTSSPASPQQPGPGPAQVSDVPGSRDLKTAFPAVALMEQTLQAEVEAARRSGVEASRRARENLVAAERHEREAGILERALDALRQGQLVEPPASKPERKRAGVVRAEAKPAKLGPAGEAGRAKRLENLTKGREPVPCDRCGRPVSRMSLGRHQRGQNCHSPAVPASSPAAGLRGVAIHRDNYRQELQRLCERSPSIRSIADALDVTVTRLRELQKGWDPTDEDLRALEFLLTPTGD